MLCSRGHSFVYLCFCSCQDAQGGSDGDKKGTGMNPNATEFQSLIYNQQGDEVDPKTGDTFQGQCTIRLKVHHNSTLRNRHLTILKLAI